MLLNGRNDAIKFVDDYGSMVAEAKRKATEELSKAAEEEPEAKPSKAKPKCK